MAKKKKASAGVEKLVPIEHHYPEELIGRFSNHMVVQRDEHEFHISFFDIPPPMALGTPEERAEQLQQISSVRATCVARIIVAAGRMPGIIRALQENYDSYAQSGSESNGASKKRTEKRGA